MVSNGLFDKSAMDDSDLDHCDEWVHFPFHESIVTFSDWTTVKTP